MLRWRLAERGGRAGAPPLPLSAELCALLHGEAPRGYGEMPAELGLYERIAPSTAWDKVRRAAGMHTSGEPPKPKPKPK
jgi:hypothetical protein